MAMHRPHRKKILAAFAIAAVTTLLALRRAGVRLQWTDSLPKGFYREVDVAIVGRGTLGIWCLPIETARFARTRAYLGRGHCPGEVEAVGKMALAIGGDTVGLDSNGVSVNGVPIPGTRPLSRDSRGRPLPHAEYGTRRLSRGEFWLWSPYSPRSYDSRYFGAVPASALVSGVRPVLTCCAARARATLAVPAILRDGRPE